MRPRPHIACADETRDGKEALLRGAISIRRPIRASGGGDSVATRACGVREEPDLLSHTGGAY